jgi:Tol biopolymer transport system component
MMKFRDVILFSIFSITLVLSACGGPLVNQGGLVAFSPDQNHVAFVSTVNNQDILFTTDLNGTNLIAHNNGKGIIRFFSITFDPFGDKLLYATSDDTVRHICIERGQNPSCAIQLPTEVPGGILSFLPNGNILLIAPDGSNFVMRIYDPNGTLVKEEGFEQFFIAKNNYKEADGRWYLKPYDQQSVRWIITRASNAFSFTADRSSLTGPVQLPGQISPAVRDVLSARSSTILSPDGQKVAFSTVNASAQPPTFNLYALDLSQPNKPFESLVIGAPFPIEFAFSPDSSQITYESNQDGHSVWIANADGSAPFKLADNASMPNWWQ